MLVLITYDVSVVTSAGRRRLRNIAKTCLDFVVRVKNSVFECEVEPAQLVVLKAKLMIIFDIVEVILRFYVLGNRRKQKVEHHGVKAVDDPQRDPLIF